MLLSKTAQVICGTKNYKHLHELGYECNLRDIIEVPIEHLTYKSKAEVEIQCDYCGKIFTRQYALYYKSKHDTKSKIEKDACPYCAKHIKGKEAIVKLYGYENIGQIPYVREKSKQTCLEKYGTETFLSSSIAREKISETNLSKYGVEFPLQSDLIRDKIKQEFINKYGVEYPSQSLQVREKYYDTMLKKYNVKFPMQNKTVQEKQKQTCIEKYGENYMDIFHDKFKQSMLAKYGKEYPMFVPELKEKMLKTLSENVSSKMEDNVYNILYEIYGDNIQHSVPIYSFILDFLLNIKDCKINIEYDGWYWHKNRLDKDLKRNNFLINRGYKVLRIRSKIELPTKEQIIDAIDYLVEDNHSYVEINLDID